MKEEKWNSFSHGVGTILAIAGLFLLLGHNAEKTYYATFSIWIYSISLIAMFAISTWYHRAKQPDLKRFFRIVDHINIYFLIAGTYTPVVLITLEKGNGWLLFFTVWGIAFLGTFFKLFFTGKFEIVSLVLYLSMGWLIMLDFQNLTENSSPMGMYLLFLGGAFYTLGILFYVWERIPYNHFIWHLFVLGGAISHWLFIYWDVV